MSSAAASPDFILTKEHLRFTEFCDACRRYRYIGLCYGPPGVGKTLSARYYACWECVEAFRPYGETPLEVLHTLADTVFYTPMVFNSPRQIAQDISHLRDRLRSMRREPLYREEAVALEAARAREDARRRAAIQRAWGADATSDDPDPSAPTYEQLVQAYAQRHAAIPDPTSLIIIDEIDTPETRGIRTGTRHRCSRQTSHPACRCSRSEHACFQALRSSVS